jgi:peptide chain release factor 1
LEGLLNGGDALSDIVDALRTEEKRRALLEFKP